MKSYKVKNVQFWIHEGHLHFCQTNELKDVLKYPWPWYGIDKKHNVNAHIQEWWETIGQEIIEKITEWKKETGQKIIKVSGYSYGCLPADKTHEHISFINNVLFGCMSVPLFLDDGPRFRGKNTTNRDITIFKKGRSIVHHLPFKWMGYHHPTGPNVKVKEIINYECPECGAILSGEKWTVKTKAIKLRCEECSDDMHGNICIMKPTKTPMKVKFLFWKIRLPYFISDHIMIKPRY